MDYTQTDSLEVLCLACQELGARAASVVPSKGVNSFAISLAVKALDKQFLLDGAVVLTDQEQSIITVGAGMKGLGTKSLELREAPRRSSGPLGVCSRWQQMLQEEIRTLRFQREENPGEILVADDAIITWMDRHGC